MIAGIFQSEQEFDRSECQMRRTYLFVDDGGIFIANMVDSPRVEPNTIRHSTACWVAERELCTSKELVKFQRGEMAMSLLLQAEADGIRVIDPKQDEWGGFGGFYKRVARDGNCRGG